MYSAPSLTSIRFNNKKRLPTSCVLLIPLVSVVVNRRKLLRFNWQVKTKSVKLQVSKLTQLIQIKSTSRGSWIKFLILRSSNLKIQLCPGLNANEIPIPYDKHHEVSSLVKSHQNTHNSVKHEVIWKMSNNPAKYEALIKQYLRSILNITVKIEEQLERHWHCFTSGSDKLHFVIGKSRVLELFHDRHLIWRRISQRKQAMIKV